MQTHSQIILTPAPMNAPSDHILSPRTLQFLNYSGCLAFHKLLPNPIVFGWGADLFHRLH